MSFHSPKAILVLGAGELGTPVIESLASRPEVQSGQVTLSLLLRPSTIATEDPIKKSQLDSFRALNVSFVSGDLSGASVDSLSTLFQPFDTVVGCTGFSENLSLQITITKAVLQSGTVKRFFPWQFGVEYDIIGREAGEGLFAVQLDVRDLLRKNQDKVEWVIVSPGMFMSFLFENFFGVVEKGATGDVTVRALGSWNTKVTVTTPEDIGHLTARIVFDREIGNQVVYIAGDTISYGELAKVLGPDAKKEEWDVEFLKGELQKKTDDALRKYRVVFGEGKGVSWGFEETYNAKHKIETKDVRTWISERN